MAYSNYLIKVGSASSTATTLIPNKYFKYDTYNATYETLDLDSYRDGNGLLHRNALEHRCAKVEWETPYIEKVDMDALMSIIRGAYDNAQEQSLYANIYIPEIDDYLTQRVYLVNTSFKIAQNSPTGIIYQPTRICFIAY